MFNNIEIKEIKISCDSQFFYIFILHDATMRWAVVHCESYLANVAALNHVPADRFHNFQSH